MAVKMMAKAEVEHLMAVELAKLVEEKKCDPKIAGEVLLERATRKLHKRAAVAA